MHEPVLAKEVVKFLLSTRSGNFFDGTIGFGGHANLILNNLSSDIFYIGTDKDANACDYCKKRFQFDNRLKVYNTSFISIDTIAKLESITSFKGILLDLGVSSYQLDTKESGFTYREDAVIDLRMDKKKGKPAYKYLNVLSEREISKLLWDYGEEKKANKLSRKIVETRNKVKIKTTFQLKEIVKDITPERFLNKTLSRVFQALRIYVNNEIDELKLFLTKAISFIMQGGRIAIISFHSIEDRVVKEFFKYETLDCICPKEVPVCNCKKVPRLKIITKKPITPDQEELNFNKRARSAKLRVAERI
ncbi:16S rRNA (cytosine(1402)-N(4))-methyltransferase RsmH [Bacteroidota bacterium]